MPVDIDKTVETLKLYMSAYRLTGLENAPHVYGVMRDSLHAIEDLQRRLTRFYLQSQED